MAYTFNCPSCNARLDYDGDNDPIVICGFCNSAVVVPEMVRSRPSPPLLPTDWPPIFDNVFNLDLNNLTNQAMSLKAIKQLVHDNREEEAAKLYQEKFGVSKAEAKAFVNSLASGQSIVFSSTLPFAEGLVFSAVFPTVGNNENSNAPFQTFSSSNRNVEWLETDNMEWLDPNYEPSKARGSFARNMVIILLLLMLLSMVFVLVILLVA